jgi:hypothetical protein
MTSALVRMRENIVAYTLRVLSFAYLRSRPIKVDQDKRQALARMASRERSRSFLIGFEFHVHFFR